MSSKPPPRRTPSGTLPAVDAMRAKMDSIMENTIPLMDQSIEALDQVLSTAPPGTDRAVTPIPPPQSVPSFALEEDTPVPTTRPSPSHIERMRLQAEPDPFGEKKP